MTKGKENLSDANPSLHIMNQYICDKNDKSLTRKKKELGN